ncbi:MAG: hypothetical protein ACXACI_06020 [Candidatus Hodarchaeales archaeon]
MEKDLQERVYLSDYYEEVDIAEALERPTGSKFWITGLIVSVSGSTIVLGDPSGKLDVHMEDTKSDDLQPEKVVRILGRLGSESHVEADWIIPLNIQLREFLEMRQLEKKKKTA